MRKITEKTIITAMVNRKCLGYFGKCFTSLSMAERRWVGEELIRRGWCDENLRPTNASMEVVAKNLHLCQC